MSTLTRRGVLLLLIPIAAVVLGTALAMSSLAADREIMGDWEITGGTTQVSDETIDVRGDVIVRDGGALHLDNCTLVINGSDDGDRELLVDATGYLEATGTHILGDPGRIWMRFYNDSLMEGCLLEHTHGMHSSHWGLTLYDGNITIRDTVINDTAAYGVVVFTNLTLVNVTLTEAQNYQMYITNTLLSDDSVVRIEDCHFNGTKAGVGRTNTGLQIVAYSSYRRLNVLVSGTRIESFNTGVNGGGTSELTCVIEDCEVVNCVSGFYIGGSVTLRRNVLTQSSLVIYAGNAADIHLEDNTIRDHPSGLLCSARWGGSYSCTVENLTLRNVTEGVKATGSSGGGRIDLAIRNSTLESVHTGFIAGQRVRISIYDTDLEVGSGNVIGPSDSWIRAYVTLDPGIVRWKGGGPIVEGALAMVDESQVVVTTIDMSSPTPRSILGWELTDTTEEILEHLYPVLRVGGHAFKGSEYDLWSGASNVVELVDDVLPEVEIAYPSDMEGINASGLVALGTFWELGSGLAHLESSLDGAVYSEFHNFSEGRWDLGLLELSDGTYNLSVRGVDSVGNVGNTSHVLFVVDTVRPFLLVESLPGLVNRSQLTVSGRTEPGSNLAIDGDPVPLGPDGSFVKAIQIDEGPNDLRVLVTDRAGNTNSTTVHVHCDTIAPRLEVASPPNATWVNETSVHVEGTVEPGSNLSIIGVVVSDTGGAFTHEVGLAEGTFEIVVTARDLAGNRAEAVVVLFVDWTCPGLTIDRPETELVITREKELWLSGQVDDPTLENVTINGKVVELFSGGFARQYVLLEGRTEFEVVATDAAGNTNVSRIVAIRDLTPPTYAVELSTLEEIGGKLYSRTTTVQAHVTLDEAAVVVFQNGTRTPFLEDHSLSFELEEGRNVLRFDVEDMAGNRAPIYAQEVHLDSKAPLIVVYEPVSGLSTKNESVLLHGMTEDGSALTVDGKPVELLPGGEFRLFVSLVEGQNEITIEAVDVLGRSNSTVVSVVREAVEGPAGDVDILLIGASTITILLVVVALVLLALRRHRRAGGPRGAGEAPPSPPDAPPKPPRPPEGDEGTTREWEEY